MKFPIAFQDRGSRVFFIAFLALLIRSIVLRGESLVLSSNSQSGTNAQVFSAHGVVQEVQINEHRLVIKHDAIPGYMSAMNMPFNIRDASTNSWQRGDEVSFQLHVTGTESWIDGIRKAGTVLLPPLASGETVAAPVVRPRHPLMDYKFTNELGKPVSLGEFHGEALAITFFFTRCPLPDYCPRLSKNFQMASQKLAAMPGAPTNWHFLSVTFDPEGDTPEVLKAYGETYHYDPAKWSFLTGPPDKIQELATQSGVKVDRNAGLINHNFRTLIVNPDGHLRLTFPFGGDLSDAIVNEILKAAGATNQTLTSR